MAIELTDEHSEVTGTIKEQKQERIRKYRREASRLASMANKRMQRLEGNKLQDSPAYQSAVQNGEARFGVRGKSHNELQAEVARMHRFLDSETSTIRGSNRVLKQMAKNTGIKYKNLTDLRKQANKFFELASKVEQYLRTVDDMASAIGYQKIWEAVNEYMQENTDVVASSTGTVDDAIIRITDAIKEYDEKTHIKSMNSDFPDAWYKLPKK